MRSDDDRLSTHHVENQVPDLPDDDLFQADAALAEGVRREGAQSFEDSLQAYGARLGKAELSRMAADINARGPTLRAFDRQGHRIDVVVFPEGWHGFLSLGFSQAMHCGAWEAPAPGAQVARAARYLMHGQVEAGSLCPITMTSAAIPLLAREPWFEDIRSRLFRHVYDPLDRPVAQKQSMMVGMGMTEKQGGSDLRSNTTYAEPAQEGGDWFHLTGHKWFFSSPMSDAHLVLARDGQGYSCFYLPRWLDDGRRNPVHIQRLKDKLGNRSNASAEVEFAGALGRRIGEAGRGIATLVEMASYTRLDCVLGSAALIRRALVQALHHARHRRAFGRLLVEQPLMRQVLTDLALESEAATALSLRLARAFDHPDSEVEQAFRRVMTPASKFWICKRAIGVSAECMEIWGGNGYIEEGPMPRLYRETPVNSIWEGSGNVMCLDVLRAARHDPQAVAELITGLVAAHPGEAALQAMAYRLLDAFQAPEEQQQAFARTMAQSLVLLVQADLLLRHAPDWVARAFVQTRLEGGGGRVYGAQPTVLASNAMLLRAWPD